MKINWFNSFEGIQIAIARKFKIYTKSVQSVKLLLMCDIIFKTSLLYEWLLKPAMYLELTPGALTIVDSS